MHSLDRVLNILSFRHDALGFVQSLQRSFGDVARFVLGPLDITLFTHPDAVESVYSQPRALRRSSMIRAIVPVTGESILVSHGDTWKKKRLTAQPVFQPSSVAALADSMRSLVDKHVARWSSSTAPVDMKRGAVDLTLEVVTAALFGRGVSDLPPGYHGTIDFIFDTLARRVENPFSPPLWIPFPRHLRFRRAIREIDSIIYDLLESRLPSGNSGTDLLGRLADSLRADSGQVNRQALRDELVTYFFAGFETTATTLAWAVYELARHPLVLEKLHADPSFAVPVIHETLRLHPPAWILDFEAAEDVSVNGVAVKKGDHVWLSQYATQRRTDFWDSPNDFLPERFLPDASRSRHKYAFFPFGASARHCIGQGFAMQELQLALVALSRSLRWTLADVAAVPEKSGFVLRPGGPILCRFSPRRHRTSAFDVETGAELPV